MNYRAWPVGVAGPGSTVRVDLRGNQAEVILMDSGNFARFKSGDLSSAKGVVQIFGTSPMFFSVPDHGSWTLVVVPLAGTTRASVQLVRRAS